MTMTKTIITDGTKATRLENLPPEAWTIIAGEGGDTTKINKLFSLVPWLYRGVDLRAAALSNLPYTISRLNGDVVYDSDEGGTIPDAIPWLKQMKTVLRLTETALTLRGKAYFEKIGNVSGSRVLELHWMLPDSIRSKITSAEGLVRFKRTIGSTTIDLEPERVLYFWPPDHTVEIGPAKNYPGRAALAAAGVLYAEDLFLKSYFDRGLIKATMLTYTQPITSKGDRDAVKRWWNRIFSGVKNAWTSEVVRGDFKPVIIGEGIADLSGGKIAEEKKEEISVALGVPQSKLFKKPGGLGDSQDQDNITFYEDTIIPEAAWIAECINDQILRSVGYELKFNPQRLSIFQADETKRAGAFRAYVGANENTPGIPVETAVAILGIDIPDGLELSKTGVNNGAVTDESSEPMPIEGTVTEAQVSKGAQIRSALDIISAFNAGQFPRDNAVFMLQTFFNVPADIAGRIVPAMPGTQPAQNEPLRVEEIRRLQRWAKKRDNPDPDEFNSDILDHYEKTAILLEMGAAKADDAPFPPDWSEY